MIQIDAETVAKLKRFAERNAHAEMLLRQGDEVNGFAVYDAEYHGLRESLVEEFLPLVDLLAQSGLLSVGIDGHGKEIDRFFGHVGGTAVTAFDNGSIVVYAPHVDSSMARTIEDHDAAEEP